VQGIHTMLNKSHIFKQCGGFDEDLQTNQEYELMIRMAQITKFDFIPEVLTVFYVTEGQLSTNLKKSKTIQYILQAKTITCINNAVLFSASGK
jgi:hypothetical protein